MRTILASIRTLHKTAHECRLQMIDASVSNELEHIAYEIADTNKEDLMLAALTHIKPEVLQWIRQEAKDVLGPEASDDSIDKSIALGIKNKLRVFVEPLKHFYQYHGNWDRFEKDLEESSSKLASSSNNNDLIDDVSMALLSKALKRSINRGDESPSKYDVSESGVEIKDILSQFFV